MFVGDNGRPRIAPEHLSPALKAQGYHIWAPLFSPRTYVYFLTRKGGPECYVTTTKLLPTIVEYRT